MFSNVVSEGFKEFRGLFITKVPAKLPRNFLGRRLKFTMQLAKMGIKITGKDFNEWN
jgi:hypothetical protein